MFVKRDLRKVHEIVGEDSRGSKKLISLKLGRRGPEFRPGNLRCLCRESFVKHFADLEYLSLYGNELKNVRNIGKTFKGSQSLKVLVLGNNQLGEAGEESIKEIGELRSLKELWLDDNRMSEIPSSFKILSNLEELRISGNRFETLNGDNLPGSCLKTLAVDRNQIERLPDSFFKNLTSLTRLELASNKLAGVLPKLPDSIQHINVSSNKLTSIDSVFEVPSLVSIRADSNLLIRLPKGAFEKMKPQGEIEVAGFSHNHIARAERKLCEYLLQNRNQEDKNACRVVMVGNPIMNALESDASYIEIPLMVESESMNADTEKIDSTLPTPPKKKRRCKDNEEEEEDVVEDMEIAVQPAPQ
eukprot:g4996.t1